MQHKYLATDHKRMLTVGLIDRTHASFHVEYHVLELTTVHNLRLNIWVSFYMNRPVLLC